MVASSSVGESEDHYNNNICYIYNFFNFFPSPDFSTIIGPNRNTFSAAFFDAEENRKSKTIVSITDYIVVHGDQLIYLGRPTINRDQRASSHVGWEDFGTFGKYGVISRKRHKVGIQ